MEDPGFVQFDQRGPFFDMVASFMVAAASCPAIFNADNPMQLCEDHYITLGGGLVPAKHIRPLEVFAQVQAGHFTMGQYLITCCSMLANTAYERVKDRNDHSPEFEFFRHVRNASSHGNVFTFLPREPARPAAWRTATIDHSLKGDANPLQGKQCFAAALGVADIIDLLADIERRIAA